MNTKKASAPNSRITLFLYSIAGLTLVAYPFLVYFGISYWSARSVALVMGSLLFLRLIWFKGNLGLGKYVFFAVGAGLVLNILAALFKSDLLLKSYPIAINAVLLVAFTHSLYRDTPLIEILARLSDKELSESAVRYCRRLTSVWAIFFFINMSIATLTTMYFSHEAWALYNGFVSYILIAILFFGERLLRSRIVSFLESR